MPSIGVDLKSLGSGLGQGMALTDVGIGADPAGAPTAALRTRAAERATARGYRRR